MYERSDNRAKGLIGAAAVLAAIGDGDGDGGPDPGKHGSGGCGNCSPDDLTTGATVEEAELEITADGLVYEEVELR
jgi:hypothetical protein